jgi:hypothetical protein
MADSYWSNPRDALFKPLPGFVVGGSYRGAVPGYGGVTPAILPKSSAVQSPTEWPQLPYPVVGMDTGTGQRDVDLNQPTSAIPDTGNIFEQLLKFKQASYPIERQQQEDAAKMYADLAQKQMWDSYLPLSMAAQEATNRNLAASTQFSTQFLKTKESTPTAIATQLSMGAAADQARLNALSTALATAKGMSYGGRNFNYSA